MNRYPTALFAIFAAFGPAVLVPAEDAPTPAVSPPSAAAPAPGAAAGVFSNKAPEPLPHAPAAAPTAAHPRPFSPEIAAALADGMPKYNPPTPTPVVNQPEEDMRDIDKPKNEIPRLPAYIVRDKRPPIFQKRDFDTTEGLVSLSYKLHPGLGIGNFLGLNDALAYQMALEQQRLDDIADLTDTAHAMSQGGDAAEGNYVLKETQETYLRPPNDWTFGGPGGGLTGSASK